MRFSSAAALIGLPLLAAADVAEYQAQFQNILGPYIEQAQPYLDQAKPYYDKAKAYVPNPNKHDPVGAAEAKAGSLNLDILTVNNWNETLFGPVTPETTTPVEWWVLFTGGNKTCLGKCGRVEEVFNQTAARFALEPNSPHTALINCENQPVLCNAWSAPTGAFWIFEILPAPAPINIWTKRFNMTTVTSDDIVKFQEEGFKTSAHLHDGFFHPYNGQLAQYGVQTAVGYALWVMNAIPSWAFMIGVSMLSRTMMSNRMQNQMGPGGAPAAR